MSLHRARRTTLGRHKGPIAGPGLRPTRRVHTAYLNDRSAEARDIAFQAAERAIAYSLAQGPSITHVQNGLPLTEHGARLLGVEWTGKIKPAPPMPSTLSPKTPETSSN